MKLVPFFKYIAHSIGKNPDGTWCWQQEQHSANEMFEAFDAPEGSYGWDAGQLDAYIKSIPFDDEDPTYFIYEEVKFNGVAFVPSSIVEMIDKLSYPSGNDSLDYTLYDFKVEFCVAHAAKVVQIRPFDDHEPECIDDE